MATFQLGNLARVLFDQYDLSQFFSEASVDQTANLPDVTTFQHTGHAYVNGMVDTKATLKGFFSGAAGEVDAVLSADLSTAADSAFTLAPTGTAIGRRTFSGPVREATYQIATPVAEAINVSAELLGDGGILPGVSLSDIATAVTPTGSGTLLASVNNLVATVNGWIAVLHLVTNNHNATSTWKIQDSADNVTFADITGGAFAASTASTADSQILQSAIGATVRQYVRAVVTGSGAGTQFATVAVVRRRP